MGKDIVCAIGIILSFLAVGGVLYSSIKIGEKKTVSLLEKYEGKRDYLEISFINDELGLWGSFSDNIFKSRLEQYIEEGTIDGEVRDNKYYFQLKSKQSCQVNIVKKVEQQKRDTPPPPPPPSKAKSLCPECGREVRWIEEYQRWYCDRCKEYKSSKKNQNPKPRPSVKTKIEEAVESLKKENEDTSDIEIALQQGNIERAIDLLDSKTSRGSNTYSIESKIEEALDSLKNEEENLDTREIETALEEGEVDEAKELLSELEDKYEEYEETLSRLKELDERKSDLAEKLARDEIDKITFNEAVESIKHQKPELEEKLNKLWREIIYEDYEKPF